MANRIINIGATANDKSGDPLRTAFNKVNQNFAEIYALLGVTSLTELAQDYAAEMFTGGTHSGVNVVYSDSTNKLNLTVVIDGGDASSTF
jgi:inhibitor of KinA sporulation pathway (predicted exonuclease)